MGAGGSGGEETDGCAGGAGAGEENRGNGQKSLFV